MAFSPERLQQVRRHQGLSQTKLAEKAHVHRTQIAVWEGGYKTPTVLTAQRLATALGIHVDSLLDGRGVNGE